MSKIIGAPLYAPAPAGGGQIAGDLAIGSSVFTKVNGVKTEFLVVHQGLPSDLYDSSCDGTWLIAKDCYVKKQWNGVATNNNYADSLINTYLNDDFINLLDDNARGIIKQVKIPYCSDKATTIYSGQNGLSCKIFLLSATEVGINSSSSFLKADGTLLSYFEIGDSDSAKSKRLAYLDGTATKWYTRTPRVNTSAYAFMVWDDGDWRYGYPITESQGTRPAFIIPSTTLISKRGIIKP